MVDQTNPTYTGSLTLFTVDIGWMVLVFGRLPGVGPGLVLHSPLELVIFSWVLLDSPYKEG